MKKNFNLLSGGTIRAGFTIIELLVAVAVTALMVSLMLIIVVNVLNGWNKSSGTLSSGNQARTVMDLITSDLQSAILRRDNNVWLVATVQASAPSEWTGGSKPTGTATSATDSTGSLYIPVFPTPLTNPLTSIEDYRFGKGGMWLRFFSTVPDSNTPGDLTKLSAPRAVSYKIVRQNVTSSGSESRYMLYRSELDPQVTFTTGYNLFGNAYYSGVIKTPVQSSLVANNVVDFGVRFLKPDASNKLVPIFPNSSDVSFAATSDLTKQGSGVDSTPKRDFPTAADVFVRVLTDEGATKISNFETTPTTETWWDIVLANSRVYSRRIEIKSNGL
jgi:prepilin-type N-terminal cleavage/methylation domain-containing protein